GASGLVVVITINAVQAAPVGLVVTISTAFALAGTAVPTSTAVVAAKTIAMTTIQKTLIAAALAVAVGVGIYGYKPRRASVRQSVASIPAVENGAPEILRAATPEAAT